MKAKELMIGDYVLVRPSMMPIQVAAINKKKVAYHAIGDRLTWVRDELIEPIPITPEILEKNGFKGEMYAFLDISPNLYLEYYYHEHRLREWWTGIDEWNNDAEVKEIVFECQCHYVHELQHALRLCGIEKEIVL